jgi:predicted O-methyltransferase YrrM
MGLSAAYQAAALEMNGQGELFTLEGAETFAQLAKRNLSDLGLGSRATVVQGKFDDNLDEVTADQVQFAFVDGNHEYEATLRYWDKLAKKMPAGSVVIFDDIRWDVGMESAWRDLQRDSRFSLVVDLFTVGVGVIGDGQRCPDLFHVALE